MRPHAVCPLACRKAQFLAGDFDVGSGGGSSVAVDAAAAGSALPSAPSFATLNKGAAFGRGGARTSGGDRYQPLPPQPGAIARTGGWSTARPPNGCWEGHYDQYGSRNHPMRMELVWYDNGRVCGGGKDDVGRFAVFGFLDRAVPPNRFGSTPLWLVKQCVGRIGNSHERGTPGR